MRDGSARLEESPASRPHLLKTPYHAAESASPPVRRAGNRDRLRGLREGPKLVPSRSFKDAAVGPLLSRKWGWQGNDAKPSSSVVPVTTPSTTGNPPRTRHKPLESLVHRKVPAGFGGEPARQRTCPYRHLVTRLTSPSPLVSPPTESSLYEVIVTQLTGVPSDSSWPHATMFADWPLTLRTGSR